MLDYHSPDKTSQMPVSLIGPDFLQSAVNEIFLALCGIPLENYTGDKKGLAMLTCCISMTDMSGEYSYMLFIDCDNMLLDMVAETIFDTDVDELDIDEILNALEELANQIAGQLVVELQKEYHLGLPCIIEKGEEHLKIAEEDILCAIELGYASSYIRLILTNL